MGRVYQRGGKTWWIEYYQNGKQVRRTSKSKTKAVAERLLKQVEGHIAEGRTPSLYFDRITFDNLAEDYLADYRASGKKTLARAEQFVAHLKEHFSGMQAPAIDTPKIRKYTEARLADGAAPATVNRELAALKRMFNLGAKCTPPRVGHIPRFPMLREDNIRKGFFEHHEFLALRAVLPGYLRGFVTFAYRSGWRVSEISNLTWNQVDRAQGIITLNPGETKNDAARTLYLDSELQSVIAEQWAVRRRSGKLIPYVFQNQRNTDRIKEFRKTWKGACEAAEIGPRFFHDFRRTAVRNMVRAGIPERVAMQLSGHKTRSIFDRYNIVNDADLIAAADRHSAYLENRDKDKTSTIVNFPTKKEKRGNV